MPPNANEYQYWSKTADRFDKANTYIVGAKSLQATQNWLKTQLRATDTALEIGCGTGIFSAVIAGGVQHLTATDMSPEMLERTRQRLQSCPNVAVKPMNGYQTGCTDSTFDMIFMGNVVHIVQDPTALLQECHRILKPGGRVLLIDFTMVGMPVLAKLAMVIRYLSQYGAPPRSNKNYRLEEMTGLVQQARFDIQDAQVISLETNAICLSAIKVQ